MRLKRYYALFLEIRQGLLNIPARRLTALFKLRNGGDALARGNAAELKGNALRHHAALAVYPPHLFLFSVD